MRIHLSLAVAAAAFSATGSCSAFQPVAPAAISLRRGSSLAALKNSQDAIGESTTNTAPANNQQTRQLQHQPQHQQQQQHVQNPLTSWFVAGTIFASTLLASMTAVPPPPAFADVELSTGALIIQTSAKEGQSILKAEVDVKDLLGTLIKNRKPIKESLGRIANVIQQELSNPVWTEVSKEILQFEGDVTPKVTISPPRDIQQTLSDISKGKLNLIVNGEIINLSVDKTSSEGEDEVVIRAKGVRGRGLPTFNEPAVTEVRTRLEDQIDAVNEFWFSPLPLPASINEKLPAGTVIETGTALLGGSVVGLAGIYGASYAYYVSEQEAAAAKAEAQRKVVAERAKRAEEAKAKKAAKDAEKES